MSKSAAARFRMILALLALIMCVSSSLAQPVTGAVRILPSATAELRDPRSLSVAPDGIVYIADTGHHRVLACDSTGQPKWETGGFGTEHGQFQWPRKVIADRGAAVWVLDYGNRRVEKFSRTLEYKGTFLIPDEDNSRPRQIEALAVSPQGDIYVFDRDGGRLLRYDPLFRLQAELGQDRGRDFITMLAGMTFVPKLGLVWWERGRPELRAADPLLTEIRTLNVNADGLASMILSNRDSCLVFGTSAGLRTWCGSEISSDSLSILDLLADTSFKRLDDIAFADPSTAYVLDGLAGAVYRLSILER